MGKPWLKLWTDTLHDRKLARLAPAGRWAWVGLLILAAETDDNGKLELSAGVPLEDEDIEDALDIEPAEWSGAKAYFLRVGMLTQDGDMLIVANYAKRQASKDPTAAERMRNMRARREDVTRNKDRNVTRNKDRNVTPMLRVEVEVEEEEECVAPQDEPQSKGNTHTPPPFGFVGRTDDQKAVLRQFQDITTQVITGSEKRVAWLDDMTASAGKVRMMALLEDMQAEIQAGRLIPYNALKWLSDSLRTAPGKNGKHPASIDDMPDFGSTPT